MMINLAISMMSATLIPFLVCILLFLLALVLIALSLSDSALPAVLKKLAEAVGSTAYLTVYFGFGLTLCMGVQLFVSGIPLAIWGWRRGWINLRSSIVVGFLIGCIPWALLIPLGILLSLRSDYPVPVNQILISLGVIPVMGVLGVLEGLIFWGVWRLLSNRSVPAA
jgi:hypothetical protein